MGARHKSDGASPADIAMTGRGLLHPVITGSDG